MRERFQNRSAQDYAARIILLLVLACISCPQLRAQQLLPGVKSLEDLALGMPRDAVVASLISANYKLADHHEGDGYESWSVEAGGREVGDLVFKNGKLDSASRIVYANTEGEDGPESAKLARALFSSVFDNIPPQILTEHGALVTRERTINCEITAREHVGTDGFSDRMLFLIVGGKTFRLSVSTGPTKNGKADPPFVEMEFIVTKTIADK